MAFRGNTVFTQVTSEQKKEAQEFCYKYREANNLSQTDLAKLLGFSKNHVMISYLEHGNFKYASGRLVMAILDLKKHWNKG